MPHPQSPPRGEYGLHWGALVSPAYVVFVILNVPPVILCALIARLLADRDINRLAQWWFSAALDQADDIRRGRECVVRFQPFTKGRADLIYRELAQHHLMKGYHGFHLFGFLPIQIQALKALPQDQRQLVPASRIL